MTQESHPKLNPIRWSFPISMLLVLLMCGDVFAANTYRVYAQVFRLGELVAKPVMTVEEGETSAGSWSAPESAQYRFVVFIRPVADEQVSVSVEFTSGSISIQPNLLVDIGKEASVVIDDTRLVLLVERLAESESEVKSLTGTSWWVEDIAGKGVVDMSHTTIEFTEDGKISGDTGCNRYIGGIDIDGQTLKTGNLAGTRKMCPDALMNQEQRFFQAIEKVVSWELAETGLLHLRGAGGVDLLRASKIEQQ